MAAVTYVSLVIGELAPKRLALSAPDRIASIMARPMGVLARLGAPLVALLSASTRAVLAPFSIAKREHDDVTEEDIRAMIAQATATGEVHETEQDIVDRVFLVGDLRVSAVMTAPSGIVTLGDILEDLVADIPRRQASEDAIVDRGGGTWLVDGSTTLDELRSRLRPADGQLGEDVTSTTVGGLVMTQLGHGPTVGERFQLRDLVFEVVDMDGRRIDRVLITRTVLPSRWQRPAR